MGFMFANAGMRFFRILKVGDDPTTGLLIFLQKLAEAYGLLRQVPDVGNARLRVKPQSF
jgi:hypothetical protein